MGDIIDRVTIVRSGSKPVWATPQLVTAEVADGTQGLAGPNFDGDFSPQS